MKRTFNYILPFFVLIIFANCNNSDTKTKTISKSPVVKEKFVPVFNQDSAYFYIKQQVDFGPRVPNTDNHSRCADYLANKMRELGAEVIVQKAKVRAYDESILNIQNIVASYYPENKRRILLFAHWDTRPVADHCDNPDLRNDPILGANDGGSGVGVLMEIGRQLSMHKPEVGVDIIFFDAEDYGTPDHLDLPQKEDTWCLGSQYWSANMHELGYFPMYGILLDMVGAENAMFYKEGISEYYAPDIVRKVWSIASKIGYSNYFIDMPGGQVTDDHLYVNQIARIPSIDIIQHDPSTSTRFGEFWHTHNDNMDIINRNTLKAVGQTVTTVIYHED